MYACDLCKDTTGSPTTYSGDMGLWTDPYWHSDPNPTKSVAEFGGTNSRENCHAARSCFIVQTKSEGVARIVPVVVSEVIKHGRACVGSSEPLSELRSANGI